MLFQVYETLHKLYKLKKGKGAVSQQPITRCFLWVIDLKTMQVRTAIENSVKTKMIEFVSSLRVYKGTKLLEVAAAPCS